LGGRGDDGNRGEGTYIVQGTIGEEREFSVHNGSKKANSDNTPPVFL